ncbi:hypothetical protein CKA32_001298 [Geitlerinema sp. FC II]|nr:hypothetical protein CKA32_001298 [Geitlerinema sp. FC II]
MRSSSLSILRSIRLELFKTVIDNFLGRSVPCRAALVFYDGFLFS